MEIRDKVIRKFIDTKGYKYIIRKKSNGHYYLVKFDGSKGNTVASGKRDIFLYLKDVYQNNGLKEL